MASRERVVIARLVLMMEADQDLAQHLQKLKTNRVRLGGFWTSENATTGCVHEVQHQLRARKFPCHIDRKICALEENDTRT